MRLPRGLGRRIEQREHDVGLGRVVQASTGHWVQLPPADDLQMGCAAHLHERFQPRSANLHRKVHLGVLLYGGVDRALEQQVDSVVPPVAVDHVDAVPTERRESVVVDHVHVCTAVRDDEVRDGVRIGERHQHRSPVRQSELVRAIVPQHRQPTRALDDPVDIAIRIAVDRERGQELLFVVDHVADGVEAQRAGVAEASDLPGSARHVAMQPGGPGRRVLGPAHDLAADAGQ